MSISTDTPPLLDLQCVRPNLRVVNVASVRQLSPFRYPGGKTWLVPEIRRWMARLDRPSVFVEPFAGGAIASLTVAAEHLAKRVSDPFAGEPRWLILLQGQGGRLHCHHDRIFV